MSSLNGALLLICFCLWRMALTTGTTLTMTVRQQGGFMSADLGASVTFKCFYEGKSSAVFFWYKQAIGQRPRLVSTFYIHDTKGDFSEEFKDNPRFTLESGNGNNHLTISDLIPSDSATYYCVSGYAFTFDFANGTTLSVKGGISESDWTIQASVHQSAETSSAALSCTVHTGSCGGEHSVYWFRDSEEAHPGLIYTHGGRNDQCERNPHSETHTCVFNLPLELLNLPHAGTYYCAVVSCGHILFGNGTTVDSAEMKNPPESLVFVLSGALAFTSILLVALIILVCTMNKRSCCSTECQRGSSSTTAAAEGYEDADSLHYAAVRTQRTNRPRAQRETPPECVYSRVRQ